MSGSHINKVEVLWDCRGEVGEGPHWVAEEGALYFVDIMEKRVLRYLYADGAKAEIKLGEYTPLVAPVQGRKGQFVVGQGKKLCLLKWDGVDGGKFELEELVETDKDKPENRLNDGKVDRSGRLWAGTMPLEPPGDPDNIPLLDAALYILGKGRSLTVAHSPVTLSNGLDWTEDGKTFYYIDSKADKVVAFDCDPETGKLSNERTVFDKMKNGVDAVLDGMALDRRGNLWVALFYGSRVLEVEPAKGKEGGDGKILGFIDLKEEARNITSVAFGGKDFGDLFITSATADDLATPKPHAGALFVVRGLRSHKDGQRVFGYPGREVDPQTVDE